MERTTTNGIGESIRIAARGDARAMDAWLRAGGDPNQYDGEGWTPLLIASARGRAELVELLLGSWFAPANPDLPHRVSGALPIHMAGHAGSVHVAEALLARRPEHLNAIWDLNGHTLLLQAVFYGHLELAQYAMSRGASTALTTARGLGPMELASQFQNTPMMEVLRPHDSPAEAKATSYRAYLARVALRVPPEDADRQRLADRLVQVIEAGLKAAAQNASADGASALRAARSTPGEGTLAEVRGLVEDQKADVNRLGGGLLQPPLVVTVTGNNGNPASPNVAALRLKLAECLLEHGADPTLHERHPMGATPFIRASVFNHLDILKAMGRRVTAARLADALNEIPIVNGLTGLHDTVLRGTMAALDRLDGYVEQTRWYMANGGRDDIEDFSGRTQRSIAEGATNPEVRRRLLEALGH